MGILKRKPKLKPFGTTINMEYKNESDESWEDFLRDKIEETANVVFGKDEEWVVYPPMDFSMTYEEFEEIIKTKNK